MERSKNNAYQSFRALAASLAAAPRRREPEARVRPASRPVPELKVLLPVPQPVPYRRCVCGTCRECRENVKWDQIFKKFERKEREVRGVFQSSLKGL